MFIQAVDIIPENRTDEYTWQIPAISSFSRMSLDKPITFFVGENGTGKSTLLEAIAVAYGFNPEGGSKNFAFSSVETHSSLWKSIRLIKGAKRPSDGFFLRAESFYNVASEIERLDGHTNSLFQSYGGKSLHQQSHGESFIALALNRFRGNGLYILDEPEAALSSSRQLALLSIMHRLVQNGSQLIIATHSPMLLAYPDARIFEFSDLPIGTILYEETEAYKITSSFIQNKDRFLQVLFSDDT